MPLTNPAGASPLATSPSAASPSIYKPSISSSPISNSSGSRHDLVLGTVVPGLMPLYGYQKLLESYQSSDITPALVLAEKYHLVSPVSSAVVMEYVPSLHPAPMREGAKAPFSFPLKMSESAKNEMELDVKKSDKGFDPFSAVTAHLNNLSTAASTSDGFSSSDKTFQSATTLHPQEENLKIARDESQPVDDSIGGAALGGGKDLVFHDNGSNKPYPMRKMKENAEFKTARKSENNESVEAPPPTAAPSLQAAPPPPAVTLSSNSPILHGATNGTIGPGDASVVDDDRESVGKQQGQASNGPMYSRSAPSATAPASPESSSVLSASPAPESAPSGFPWIGSLGVQPQMEVSQEKRRALEMKGDTYAGMRAFWSDDMIGNFFANVAQVLGSHDGFSNAHPMLLSALSIFVLIFMWIYAFFKLVKAIANNSLSHK